jgi:hypothetical protein
MQWLPLENARSQRLDAHALRRLQNALLAMAQALSLFASPSDANLVSWIHGVQESEHVLAACSATGEPDLLCFTDVIELLRHAWCVRLGLHSYEQHRYDLAYWCVANPIVVC